MMVKKVIHFIESGGGGSLTAMISWIQSTPTISHTILLRPRSGEFDRELLSKLDVRIYCWEGSIFRGILVLRNLLQRDSFDVLHLHSTWSGLARILKWRIPIAYSPHCFAFEGKSKESILRKIYFLVEKVLGVRTDGFVVVSHREKSLASTLNPRSEIIVIDHPVHSWIPKPATPKVIAIGRIAKQKDPESFAEIAKKASLLHSDLHFVWIGDGDKKLKKLLQDNKVEVTGWLDQVKVRDEASNALCLLHTATWEGMPVVFAEMWAAGIPIIARRANYTEGLDDVRIFGDTDEALKHLNELYTTRKRLARKYINFQNQGINLSRFYTRLVRELD